MNNNEGKSIKEVNRNKTLIADSLVVYRFKRDYVFNVVTFLSTGFLLDKEKNFDKE